MIFRQIDEILDGRKTQTRRVCKPGETCKRYIDDTIWCVRTPSNRTKWERGHTYAIQPKRGQPGLKTHRIRITALRQERLGAITEDDAKAEGCPDGEDFPYWWYMGLWDEINGKGSHESNPLVWVIEFECVAAGDGG